MLRARPAASSLTAAQREGYNYERKLLRELGRNFTLWTGQWFAYEDENGKIAFAQPDAVIHFPKVSVIVEAKLTQSEIAFPQLQFYSHLLRSHEKIGAIATCQVFQNCAEGSPEPAFDFVSLPLATDGEHFDVNFRF